MDNKMKHLILEELKPAVRQTIPEILRRLDALENPPAPEAVQEKPPEGKPVKGPSPEKPAKKKAKKKAKK
jgi:hypothetical protein